MSFIDKVLFSAVVADVDKAMEQAQKEDNNYNRKAYVRTVFAAIEAITYMFKGYALNNEASGIFSIAELSLLKEESYGLDSKCKAISYPRKLAVAENYRFSVEMMMRKYDDKYNIDVTSNGWRHLKNAIKTRNRITHPRNIKDMELSDHDMSEVLLAFSWVKYNIMRTQMIALEVTSIILNEEPGEAYNLLTDITSKYEDV